MSLGDSRLDLPPRSGNEATGRSDRAPGQKKSCRMPGSCVLQLSCSRRGGSPGSGPARVVPSEPRADPVAGGGREGLRRATRGACLALILANWAPPSPALADVRPPVELQIDGPARAARAGRRFCGTLLVSAYRSVRLDSLQLAGEGWRIERFRAPQPRMLDPRKPLRVAFRVVPSDPAKPLVIRAVLGGSLIEKWFDLSAEAAARSTRPGGVTPVPKRRRRRRPCSYRRPVPKPPSTPEVTPCAAIR